MVQPLPVARTGPQLPRDDMERVQLRVREGHHVTAATRLTRILVQPDACAGPDQPGTRTAAAALDAH